MATTPVTVQVSTIGTDCGPFTIADNVTGTITTGVSRTTLLSGIVVNADDTATSITVTSTGVCAGANLNFEINGIFCPPPPIPEYSYWLAHYYPCDGFCESPGDVVVAFPGDFTPNYTKWYRGPEFIYKVYDVATAPYDIYLSDTTEYASCLAACEITPPPPTYEWYELIDCSSSAGLYSQAYPPGTFSINDRVINVSETNTYRINNTYITNPGGIQILIVATGYTDCPTTPPPSNCRQNVQLNVTDYGYIKYYNCTTDTTDYQYLSSLGTVTLTNCVDYTTIIPGFPLIDVAAFTIINTGTTCGTTPPTPPPPPGPTTWLVRNADCGYGVIYDVGINGDYMNTLDGPSTFPLTSTLYGTKSSPGGINYNSTDNAITAHVTTNLPGSGNCGIMYLIFNGEYSARYETTFRTSPFVTISGVYIQDGDQVEVRINCYPGECP
jgi:hypothetical protein